MKYIDDALLMRPCNVGLCIDERVYLREMRRFKIKSPSPFVIPGMAATMHWLDDTTGVGESVAIVCVDMERMRGTDGIQLACMLVHECVHIFQNICKHWGEEAPSAEFEAYAIQRLSQQLMYMFCELRPELRITV
ncbi:hypothetical protein B0G76_2852 [Paraburkholderia sp. BL23I1N1]|uniref:hypothetical protein n=1 Tax=Paraburkholderia sp. BL23I1N1 TaxID=1938802 RepID=UPI000E712057|nr:hypothetical protein [Paraburkholderia sp. BL23I1N1]RKE36650.1 hypothetical protein B0G76_2852 [Paraburkholderia sp. BL23I1N1]